MGALFQVYWMTSLQLCFFTILHIVSSGRCDGFLPSALVLGQDIVLCFGQDTLLSQCLSTGPLGSYAEVAFTWSVVIIDFVTLSWVWKVLSGSGS